jgi:hypothetical protein
MDTAWSVARHPQTLQSRTGAGNHCRSNPKLPIAVTAGAAAIEQQWQAARMLRQRSLARSTDDPTGSVSPDQLI